MTEFMNSQSEWKKSHKFSKTSEGFASSRRPKYASDILESKKPGSTLSDRSAGVKNFKLQSSTQKVSSLTDHDKLALYDLFAKYYEGHSFTGFLKDLSEKSHIIILRCTRSGQIKGFSTLLRVDLKKFGERGTGIFSGDTVIEKEYWGNKSLGVEFLKYLWLTKIKNPTQPVYWFLISKGYKTYLLMANNFACFYPRPNYEIPVGVSRLMNAFYSTRFGDFFDSAAGIVRFNNEACRLKENVAEVSPQLMTQPLIAFFVNKNPSWAKGEELACIAEMPLLMPLKYWLKKTLFKRKSK